MPNSDTLVSIVLPVRNGADRIEGAVRSVLAQDHENLQLVISDNASTDGTEEICRDLAAGDRRIRYRRHPVNVGLFDNFVGTVALTEGAYFRWVGDDDRLEPSCVSRSLRAFAEDDRLVLVTTQVAYTGPDGTVATAPLDRPGLGSDDPVERFTTMLRLLNESHLLVDPLYGLLRRDPTAGIRRRNMLREDEVFAAKLALAGPWGHVPEVLAHRNWKHDPLPAIARRLDVPPWRARCSTVLQCAELLRWLRESDLGPRRRRRARAAVLAMYARRHRLTAARRGRRLASAASGLLGAGR
jgi:glycosyltransferase involved in cell wall biosynthesis